jgi:hypothetical protein
MPSCSGVTIPQGAGFVTILSVSLPSGSYVITAKTNIASVNAVLDNPCQLVTESAGVVLDSTMPSNSGDALLTNLANLATATLSGPDSILFQCAAITGAGGTVTVTNSQLIATQVNGIN